MIQKLVLLLSFSCVAILSSFGPFMKKSRWKNYAAVTIMFIGMLSACGTNISPEEIKLPSNDSSVFYPVREFFISQVMNTDNLSNIIYTYTDSDNRKDSVIIDSVKFNELAKPFLQDDINDTAIKKYYRESIFHDATTASNTFNYTSVNNNLPLQTLDVLLDTSTDIIKRVFITKRFVKDDSLFTEKMSWKTGQSFSINRIIQTTGNKEITQQINVKWNSNN